MVESHYSPRHHTIALPKQAVEGLYENVETHYRQHQEAKKERKGGDNDLRTFLQRQGGLELLENLLYGDSCCVDKLQVLHLIVLMLAHHPQNQYEFLTRGGYDRLTSLYEIWQPELDSLPQRLSLLEKIEV